MIVYHGSNHNFKKLRIDPKLCERRSIIENEGYGIYFSTDINIAKSYGSYIYVIEIDDASVIDFRNVNTCGVFLYRILNSVKTTSLYSLIDHRTIYRNIYYGGVSIWNLYDELALNLDSCDIWYTNFSQSQRDSIFRTLKRECRVGLKAYMFNYHIQNIGVIKDLSCCRIVDKFRRS